jgi:uncharacterized damage-inducible protein DinB
MPTFVKVLRALPQGKLDYRSHPKSRSAAEIAWCVAQSEAALISLLDTGTVNWNEGKPPERVEDIASAYERNAAGVNERLGKLDEAGWQKKGKFLMGEGGAWEDTIEQFVWGFLFDSIHHRGQLTAYLRPMGGKVPSIYGPSGDDPGQ